MFKFNERQKERASDFFANVGTLVLTGTVLVQMTQFAERADSALMTIAGLLGTVVFFIVSLLAIRDVPHKERR